MRRRREKAFDRDVRVGRPPRASPLGPISGHVHEVCSCDDVHAYRVCAAAPRANGPVPTSVIPEVLRAATVVALPAGVAVARPTLLVGPMPAALIAGSGHDDVTPLAATTLAALDVRREIRVVIISATVVIIVVPTGARIAKVIAGRIVVHARVKAPPPATNEGHQKYEFRSRRGTRTTAPGARSS